MSASPVDSAPAAWILRGGGPRDEHLEHFQIWGLTPEERLRRSFARAGCASVAVVDPKAPPEPPRGATVAVFRGDVVVDERLVGALVARPDTVLVAPGLGAVAGHVACDQLAALLSALESDATASSFTGAQPVTPDELVSPYTAKLRKWAPPFVYPARFELARQIEDRIFAASYKGVTDLVTKWVWPRPAAAATRVCARAGVHPNIVTLASWVLAIVALVCFATGAFGIGLVAAWLMTFLDTVDGKLARVTLTSSEIGNVLDHGLDLLHPPFWYLAWGLGLAEGHALATAIAVGGYVVGRLLEGAFLASFGIETHSWRPIDGLFRTITARRNPNLILLTVGALGGRPDLGLVMVALWTVVSLAFHAVRLVQAFALRRRGAAIEAWDARTAAPEALPRGFVGGDT